MNRFRIEFEDVENAAEEVERRSRHGGERPHRRGDDIGGPRSIPSHLHGQPDARNGRLLVHIVVVVEVVVVVVVVVE